MRSYRRLPHLDAPGFPAFVTWRLAGSLPPERIFQREHLTSGQAFVAFDRLLDSAASGPVYLRQAEIAQLVVDELREAATAGLCLLHAFVVMPNHVHALWTPQVSIAALMQQVKGATGFRANRLLGLAGQPFWQDEYFDRLARNDREISQMRRYIEWNPVKAGLAARPEEFPWSSASAGPKPRAG